jgi:hypothetical protein
VRGILEGSLLHLVGLSFPANSHMLACRRGPLMSIINGNIDGLTNVFYRISKHFEEPIINKLNRPGPDGFFFFLNKESSG